MHGPLLYLAILTPVITLFGGAAVGYMVGLRHRELKERLQELANRKVEEPAPEPAKPAIVGGAYAEPRPVSNVPNRKRSAGLVETKTPERLEWEEKQSIEALATSTDGS